MTKTVHAELVSERMVASLEGVALAMGDPYFRAAYHGVRQAEARGEDPLPVLLVCLETVCHERARLAEQYALWRIP